MVFFLLFKCFCLFLLFVFVVVLLIFPLIFCIYWVYLNHKTTSVIKKSNKKNTSRTRQSQTDSKGKSVTIFGILNSDKSIGGLPPLDTPHHPHPTMISRRTYRPPALVAEIAQWVHHWDIYYDGMHHELAFYQ